MTSLKKSLPALMLAGALVAGTAVAAPAWDSSAPLANNFSSRNLSAPLGDAGDPDIRNMPVVRGSYQQYLR